MHTNVPRVADAQRGPAQITSNHDCKKKENMVDKSAVAWCSSGREGCSSGGRVRTFRAAVSAKLILWKFQQLQHNALVALSRRVLQP
jgi:hypothetical protein